MPTCSSSSTARWRAAVSAFMPRWMRSGFGDLPADGQHRVERGHRVLEDHGDLFAADVPPSRFRSAGAGRARGNERCPLAISPGGMGIRRRIDSMVTDLPQPLSPTTARVSPSSSVEGDAVDRVHGAFRRVEAGASGR